jgi:hypothetical protein
MRTTSIEPHPDELTDRIKLKQIKVGSRQAIQDSAIDAYHKAIEQGRTREEAEEEYFKQFNNSLQKNNNG